jgi:Protein of unknown function (DUF2934)
MELSVKTVTCHLEALTLEQRIWTRADELWKQDGSLESCADEYWRQARRLIELEVANESAVTGDGQVAEQNNLTLRTVEGIANRVVAAI